ncbi:MAG TPA: glutamate-5-semialdehyde dehydrogenase [Candidatus Methylacidiphilales bacterium]|nr:glutamate-5-semialdehyde dehydrogenase [Candidatus Methylacidiphilales bacterium]
MERPEKSPPTDNLLKTWPNTREQHPDFAQPLSAIRQLCREARDAARLLATLPAARFDEMLDEIATQLEREAPAIFEANKKDIAAAEEAGLTKAVIDRLRITEKSLAAMVTGVRQVRALPQPLGQKIAEWERPNGIKISKIRVPIGVIAIIYESRPNVTIDAAVLCLKTGNATVLRGGKEAIHSNRALVAILQKCVSLPKGAVQLVDNTDRALVPYLCRQSDFIDLIIPRGGHSLIETVVAESRIPVIKHAHGVCSVFVHEKADLDMAEKIILNAKVQRPGVCNAIETLLIDRAIADKFTPRIIAALAQAGVEIRGDQNVIATSLRSYLGAADDQQFLSDLASARSRGDEEAVKTLLKNIKPKPDDTREPVKLGLATEADWTTEYLDLILAVRIVGGLDGALEHLAHYSSHHSDAIVTEDAASAERYLNEVDSATVYWNASTRFTDGGEFGFGAEIGISTDKLHARGPMGLEELTSYKFVIRGNGQVRG